MRCLCVLGALAGMGCDIFGNGPVGNPFPPIPDAGVVVRVRNEVGIIVDATIVFTDDGVEVRRTNLVVAPSIADQFIEIEKTIVDRIIALAVVSNKNTSLPSNLKPGDPLFAKVFLQGTDFVEGDTLTIVIKTETPVVQPLPDCNANQVPDVFEISLNPAADCNEDGELDACQIAANPALDCNGDGKLNACDNQSPVITACPASRMLSLDLNCAAVMPDMRSELQATDNCTTGEGLIVTQSPAGGSSISAAGPIEVTFNVTDADGNSTSCTATITAQDITPPVIDACETTTTIDTGPDCIAELPDYVAELPATDNCTTPESLIREQSPPAGTPVTVGDTIPVTLTVRDQSGLSANCIVLVKAIDHVAPIVTCPDDVTVQCDTPLTPGVESAVGMAHVEDDCDASPDLTYTDVVIPYDPKYDPDTGGGKGTTCGILLKRTWVATDSSGNSSSCMQEIFVTDTTPPEVTCPPDVQIECGESTDPENPDVGHASVSDICDSEPQLDYFDSADYPNCETGQVILRTWYSYDRCGNYSDCTQVITVRDTQPPVLTVPPDVTVQCDDPTDTSHTGCATALDACTHKRSVSHEDEVIYPEGGPICGGYLIIRHWTGTDLCNNSTSADQIITVTDSEPPVITECPGDLELPVDGNCKAVMPDLTEDLSAYDNCSKGYYVQQSPAPGTILTPGVHVVTFTVSDDCENISECTADVTVSPQVVGGVLFVNYAADGADDGTSWSNAFTDLSRALSRAACANMAVEVWVAQGTYRPDSGTGDRGKSFVLRSNIRLYGGFVGNETSLEQRDPKYNQTVLSGELGQPGISDNSIHILLANQVAAGAVLDGFTITGGNANIAPTSAEAGALLMIGSSPTIRNCKFHDNRAVLTGGAIECRFGSHPTIENCRFTGNTAATGGALRASSDSQPIVRNCLFSGNTATLGGAVEHGADSWPTYVNCVFAYNWADGGGAIANTGANSIFINCTIYENTAGASRGGGIRSNGGNQSLVNCIVWNNTDSGNNVTQAQIIDFVATTTVTYSCIQDAVPGDGLIPFGGAANHNIDLNPHVNTPPHDEYSLKPESPCIDAGSNAAVPAGITTDFAGNQRIVDGDFNEVSTVDMGAVEFQGE